MPIAIGVRETDFFMLDGFWLTEDILIRHGMTYTLDGELIQPYVNVNSVTLINV